MCRRIGCVSGGRSGREGLRACFADVAEEAQAELLAVPVGGGLPVVEPRKQPLASWLQLGRRVDLQERGERAVEALVGELAEDIREPPRVIAQAVQLECDRARV